MISCNTNCNVLSQVTNAVASQLLKLNFDMFYHKICKC